MEFKRTHKCGELRSRHTGEEVVINGWIQKRRDHGGVIFVDIRDRSGLVQTVFNPDIDEESFNRANELRSEFVVGIRGIVRKRPEGTVNPDLHTGKIEIKATDIKIFSRAKTPAIQVEDNIDVGEELRLKYRYLDLRRPEMTAIMGLRHKIMKTTRDYLTGCDFWEIETPILTRSTPEGARDYLVPSRISPGNFYALPQSPQIFKQLLMCSGMERYFQIARCFRDEDLRANRQPEFTQIDLEMSFVNREDVMAVTEGLMKELFSLIEVEVPQPVPVLSYDEAMEHYGSDKPDLRYGMKLKDISEEVAGSEFKVFSQTIAEGGQVKGIKVDGGAKLPRSRIDEYTEYVKLFRAQGLAWMAFRDTGLKSPIAKFLTGEEIAAIREKMGATQGDLLLFVADKPEIVARSLGNLRCKIAEEMDLIPDNLYKFVWIVDFPLLEFDEDEDRYLAKHHPFTSPLPEDTVKLDSKPGEVRANAYDLVLNGEELGGGSIRVYERELQEKIFSTLNMSSREVEDKFGFLLDAFAYGTPPHGGIALGMDRLVMIMGNTDSIRDVIAFPKTQKATSPLTHAPSAVEEEQLRELKLRFRD